MQRLHWLKRAVLCTGKYAIGYAVAPALEGPYTKPLAGPWLDTTNGINGLVRSAAHQQIHEA